mmetsp:Transcript_35251/g.111405  ORF Transcript_35251/g.111405 Transcript_35251/m.111405 type:complete len:221 (-) Transcript_35251:763-1425(-)
MLCLPRAEKGPLRDGHGACQVPPPQPPAVRLHPRGAPRGLAAGRRRRGGDCGEAGGGPRGAMEEARGVRGAPRLRPQRRGGGGAPPRARRAAAADDGQPREDRARAGEGAARARRGARGGRGGGGCDQGGHGVPGPGQGGQARREEVEEGAGAAGAGGSRCGCRRGVPSHLGRAAGRRGGVGGGAHRHPHGPRVRGRRRVRGVLGGRVGGPQPDRLLRPL